MHRLSIFTVLCVLLAWPDFAVAQGQNIEGKYYQLYHEGSRGEAESTLRFLDLAYGHYKTFFKAAPKLDKSTKLRVCFYKNKKTWAAGIAADGTKAPNAGGYYWPTSKTAYLYQQATEYYTRVLLIHEAAHQFHYLSCTQNKNLKAGWYTEGVAEHLAYHFWDGENLKLGVAALSLKDYPGEALKDLTAKKITLKELIEGKSHRALGSMLVRFFVSNKPYVKRFQSLRVALDSGKDGTKAFIGIMGDPDKLQKPFVKWLKSAQAKWVYIYNEWEQIAGDKFYGHSKNTMSLCRLAGEATFLESKLKRPVGGRWQAGLLLSFDNSEYTVALLDESGTLRVNKLKDGKWQRLAEHKLLKKPKAGQSILFQAKRSGKTVTLTVNSKRIGKFKLTGGHMGLALDGCQPRFFDTNWKLK
jgi:hypothetical protein